MEEDQRTELRIDADSGDFQRQFAFDRWTAQHDAGAIVVLVEPDEFAGHPEKLICPPRHAVE